MSRVAAVQFAPVAGDVAGNLARIEALAREAAADTATLAVFPECGLSGYQLGLDEAGGAAVDASGPEVDRLGRLAVELRITLVVGFLERTPEALFNAAVTLLPDGQRAGYRKAHLPRMGVDNYCTPGDGPFRPVATPDGPLGVLICYDLRFPEPARLLALAGATRIAVPTNWPTTATDYPDYLLRARASENRVAIVAADRVGEERGVRYLGRSQIVEVDGTVVIEAGPTAETVVVQSLASHGARIPVAGRPDGPDGLLADRRTDLYQLTDAEAEPRSAAR